MSVRTIYFSPSLNLFINYMNEGGRVKEHMRGKKKRDKWVVRVRQGGELAAGAKSVPRASTSTVQRREREPTTYYIDWLAFMPANSRHTAVVRETTWKRERIINWYIHIKVKYRQRTIEERNINSDYYYEWLELTIEMFYFRIFIRQNNHFLKYLKTFARIFPAYFQTWVTQSTSLSLYIRLKWLLQFLFYLFQLYSFNYPIIYLHPSTEQIVRDFFGVQRAQLLNIYVKKKNIAYYNM